MVSSRPSSPKTKLKEFFMNKNTQKTVLYMTRCAIIAALYVVLTYLSFLFGLASGPVQLVAVSNGINW